MRPDGSTPTPSPSTTCANGWWCWRPPDALPGLRPPLDPPGEAGPETFPDAEVVVLGLHSVFEHHDAMTPVGLRASAHENRLRFPIAVDRHDDGHPEPVTFRRYRMQGTPTTVLIDRTGRIGHTFGAVPDLALGARIAGLLASG